MLARTGWGTPSLPESTNYEMVRLSLNYWLLLTLYRNSWVARRIVDVPADDMTRAWPKLNCDVSPEDIQKFDRTIRRTRTAARINQSIKWGRLYGGAGALIAIKGHEKFLDEPLDLDDVTPGSYLGLIPFDRWVGIYPSVQISEDVEHPLDWGLPQYYECTAEEKAQTFKVHSSRVLRFIGPEVPTPEFQAQSYWGLSVLEPAFEPLRMHDNALWAIINLLFRANVIARIDPDLAQILSGLGVSNAALQRYQTTMQAQNELMSNQSMMVLPKEGDMKSVQYSFSGIGDVLGQIQMEVAGAAEISITRLFGRTVTGLGQTNDADERLYEVKIAKDQDSQVRPQLDKLYPVICMSEFGEVPDDLDFTFPSIRVLTEEEKAEMTDKGSAPILAAYNSGVISQKTTLQELRQLSDTTNVFSNITDEDIESAEDEPIMPGEGNEAEGATGKPSPDRAERRESAGADGAFDAAQVVDPPKGADGLFEDTGEYDEAQEAHLRDTFSKMFQYADPWSGDPRVFDKNGDYLCGDCNKYESNACLAVEKQIDAKHGSCRHWENLDGGDPELLFAIKISKNMADYGVTKNDGFGCKRCEYHSKAKKADSQGRTLFCRQGAFRVFNNGCCALNDAPGMVTF